MKKEAIFKAAITTHNVFGKLEKTTALILGVISLSKLGLALVADLTKNSIKTAKR